MNLTVGKKSDRWGIKMEVAHKVMVIQRYNVCLNSGLN